MNKLDKNENNFGHHPAVKKVLHKPISLHDLNFYPPENNKDIYSVLAKFLRLKPENLYISNGLESVLLNTWRNLHLSGVSSIILPESCWNHYYNLAQQSFFDDSQTFVYPTPVKNNIFYSDLHLLKSTLKQQSKPTLVIITNPNNPTGHETCVSELVPLFDQYPQHIFLIDEAYIGLGTESYQDSTTVKLIKKYKNLILGRSFSKFFCCPGLRFGYIIANSDLIEKLRLRPYYLGIRSMTGIIVKTLIENYNYYCTQAEKIKKSRNNFIKLINQNKNFKAFDSSSNCVLIKINQKYNPDNLLTFLKKNDFIIKLIKDKPLENYLRISVAPEKVLIKLSALLNQYFDKN